LTLPFNVIITRLPFRSAVFPEAIFTQTSPMRLSWTSNRSLPLTRMPTPCSTTAELQRGLLGSTETQWGSAGGPLSSITGGRYAKHSIDCWRRLHEALADAHGDNLSAPKCPSQANFAAALLSSSAF
jgi:hypothetical protein